MSHYLIRYHGPRGEAWTFITAPGFATAWTKARKLFGDNAYSVELWAAND